MKIESYEPIKDDRAPSHNTTTEETCKTWIDDDADKQVYPTMYQLANKQDR